MYAQRNPSNSAIPVKPTKPAPKVGTTQEVRGLIKPANTIVTRNVPAPPPSKAASRKSALTPDMALMVLLVVIIVGILGGLVLRMLTRPPRVVFSPASSTTTGGAPGTRDDPTGPHPPPIRCVSSREGYGLDKPIIQPVGQDKHHGGLPDDVQPESYDITVYLTGATLGPTMNISARVEAHLHVYKATDKVVLKAKADTVKDIRVAMLDGTASPCSRPWGLAVDTVSHDADFLIVRLKTPLAVGHPYRLVTVHRYQPATDGPITVKETLGRMELEQGRVHAAFPCYEKKGLLVPITLTINAPGNLTAVANEEIDCNFRRNAARRISGTERAWKFATTMPMPLHKLAWAVFPPTLKAHDIIPGLVRQFAENEDTDLREAVKKFFLFLEGYFQEVDNRYISKLDFVVGTEVQDSIGFLLLNSPVTIKGVAMCSKVAQQWTSHLLPQHGKPSWLASSGAPYLCRLAFADDEDGVVAAFQADIDKCIANAATDDVKALLAFRMAHISVGDSGTKKALKKHIDEKLFKDDPGNDATLDIFSPALPKEKLQAFLGAGYETVKLVRTFGAQKKLTWKEPKATAVLVATNAVSSTLKLKTPDGFNVSWLDASKPDTQLVLADDESLFVNPGVMACYGVELDNITWALAGRRMEMEKAHVLNARYLLSQASNQYANVSWPHDIAGFFWACGVLKSGDTELWDHYAKQFSDFEYHANTMLVLTPDLEKAYKRRVQELIEERINSINSTTDLQPPSEKASTAVLLANVACFVGSAKCAEFTAGLEGLALNREFKTKVQAKTLLAPEAVACQLGSSVKEGGTIGQDQEAELSLRLAFEICLPAKLASGRLKGLAYDVLTTDMDDGVRLSSELRTAMLFALSRKGKLLQGPQDIHERAIFNAINLRVIRSREEVEEVVQAALKSYNPFYLDSAPVQAIQKLAVWESDSLENWAHERQK